MADKVTPKQEAFIRAYVKNGQNATKAAMIAYPDADADSARAMGSQNLAKLNIRQRIEDYRDEVQRLNNLEVSDTLKDLQLIIDTPGVKPETKLRAMELKGKIIGAFIDRTENKSTNEIVVRDASVDELVQDWADDAGNAEKGNS